jgi:hypothetical protein
MRMIIGRSLRPLNSSRRMLASVGVTTTRPGKSKCPCGQLGCFALPKCVFGV